MQEAAIAFQTGSYFLGWGTLCPYRYPHLIN